MWELLKSGLLSGEQRIPQQANKVLDPKKGITVQGSYSPPTHACVKKAIIAQACMTLRP